MRIEEIPTKIGLKRSIALYGTLLFILGASFGYIVGFEDTNYQVSQNLQIAADNQLHDSRYLLHAGAHYYKIQEIPYNKVQMELFNTSCLNLYNNFTCKELYNDSIRRTP